MARKNTVKDISGNIISMLDETNGGFIVRNRQVVNAEKWEEYKQKEQDRLIASQAQIHQISNPDAPDRTVTPNKVQELEKKVEGMEAKLDAILNALKK